MGFFFADEKIKKKDKNLVAAKEYSCKVCPRNSLGIRSPKMPPSGTNKPVIYILGESPGKNEDYLGRQFVGDSGDVLHNVLKEVFEDTDYNKFIRYNNSVRCFNNNIKPTPFEIDCCYKSLVEDIEKTQPQAIFTFGDTPLKTLLGGKMISMWRGRIVPAKIGNHECWVIPMYHPAYILRNREKKNMSEYEKCFVMDIYNACDFIFNDYYKPSVIDSGFTDNVTILKDKMEVFNQLNVLRDKPYVALDIETTELKPYEKDARLISISIGTDEKVYAFKWDDDYKDLLHKFLLRSGEKIAHNLKFELEWFLHLFGSQDILRETKWHDTMAQAYLLDERTSKDEGMLSLDRLTQLYFGFNLKEKSNVDRKNLLKSDMKDVLIYNGMDSKYTYKLFFEQQKRLDKQLKICYNNLIKTTVTLTVVQNKGIVIDNNEIKVLQKKYQKELDRITKEINEIKEVKQFWKEFNPLSPDHLVTIFKDIYKLPKLKETGKKKEYAVDNEVLKKFMNEYDNKLAKLVMEFRDYTKRKSTYVDAVEAASINGILNPQFNLLFTGTGRLSGGKSQE